MDVEYAATGQVARIHFNRPDRLNAVVPSLVRELILALERAHAEGARAVVLAGRGRAFCAGHDLKEPTPVESMRETRARLEEIQDVTRRIRSFPGPVIAAVHGYALGAGCEFALGCDLIVADSSATFGFPEVSVGLSVTGGISSLLPRVVGLARAKELLLLGEHIPAAHAAEMGLINRVVAAGAHEDVAMDIANLVASRPPVSVSLAKRVMDAGADATMEEAMATEVEHAILTSLSGEGDAPKQAFTR